MLNKQPPMKQERIIATDATEQTLLVHSIFPTIQGEGIYSGYPCVFLRLGGCNLQCPDCDTEYTSGSVVKTNLQIANEISIFFPSYTNKNMPKLVVITGGEPMRQRIGALIGFLNILGYTVQIETNGTLFDDSIDFSTGKVKIMCSPKTGRINSLLEPHITAYKYVGGADERELDFYIEDWVAQDHSLLADGLPARALGHTAKPYLARPPKDFKGPIYLQPIDRQSEYLNKHHTKAVVDSCQANGYILCLQTHKIVGVE